MFQSDIKNETNYLHNVQEDCFYTEQNTTMRGKFEFTILYFIMLHPVLYEIFLESIQVQIWILKKSIHKYFPILNYFFNNAGMYYNLFLNF